MPCLWDFPGALCAMSEISKTLEALSFIQGGLPTFVYNPENFRDEIIWCYRKWSVAAGQFVRNHDVILFYTKGCLSIFNVQYVPTSEGTNRRWKGRKQRAVIVDGVRKATSEEGQGETPYMDWWEVSILNPNASERAGYPTQKPLALYERIIKASSNEGDVVLDPFAGCATTCVASVASERLGRKWVGMDIWGAAHEVVVDRLRSQVGLFGEVCYIIPLVLPSTCQGNRDPLNHSRYR